MSHNTFVCIIVHGTNLVLRTREQCVWEARRLCLLCKPRLHLFRICRLTRRWRLCLLCKPLVHLFGICRLTKSWNCNQVQRFSIVAQFCRHCLVHFSCYAGKKTTLIGQVQFLEKFFIYFWSRWLKTVVNSRDDLRYEEHNEQVQINLGNTFLTFLVLTFFALSLSAWYYYNIRISVNKLKSE